jgi:hypothetical protein
MITEDPRHIGRCAKGETPAPIGLPDRLTIEWTAQL